MTLGQRIQELRKQNNLSQEALGEKLGVSRQAISRWEMDGAVPEIDKLIAMGKLFGVSLNELLQVETGDAGPEPKIVLALPRLWRMGVVVLALLTLLSLGGTAYLSWRLIGSEQQLTGMEQRLAELEAQPAGLDPSVRMVEDCGWNSQSYQLHVYLAPYQLVDNLEAEIPDGMVETQLDKIMDEYAMRMSGQGMSMDDYLKMMGMTPEMLRTSAKPSALRQVKTQLALEAVAAAENMEVTDEECDAEVAKLAEQYKLTAEQVKAAVSLDALKQDLLLQKASKLVVDEAKVGEAPKKEEPAEEKPKKTTRKKKTEEAAGEEGEEKPKRTRKKKTEESAEEPKAE